MRYLNESATDIAIDLITRFAPGYTTHGVQAGLDTLDEITFTNVPLPDALTQLAKRIGGYWRCDYFRDIHFFTSEATDAPTDLTPSHPSLESLAVTRDLSQVITRQPVQGGGVNALADVPSGDTIIPVETEAWYESDGGTVMCGPQRITYTGVTPSGIGALVGPGVGPSAAPALELSAGAGVESGIHIYAVVFRTSNDASLSLSSPTAAISVGAVPTTTTPVAEAFPFGSTASGLTIGATYRWKYSYTFAGGETAASVASNTYVPIDNGHGFAQAALVFAGKSIPDGFAINWYRSVNGGTYRQLSSHLENLADLNTAETDAAISTNAAAPSSNTVAVNRVALSAIPIGATSVTQRWLYRTTAGSSQLKKLAVIADNTTTTYTDSIADAGLGADIPTSDTSGLTQPDGQILPGATSLLVAGGAFPSTGGWAIIGNGAQAIRFTDVSAGSLTGIPATGPGAITAAISYNSTVTAAATLTGIPRGAVLSASQIAPANWSHLLISIAPAAASTIAFDAATDGAGNTTYNHTTGAGSNRLLLFFLQTVGGAVTETPSYGSQFLTLVGSQTNAISGSTHYIYALVAPATGTAAVHYATSGSAFNDSCVISYAGCAQTVVPDSLAQSGNAVSLEQTRKATTTTVADNCWLVMSTVNAYGDGTAGFGTTKRKASGGGGMNVWDSNGAITPAGGVGSILYDIKKGDPVNLFVVVDDEAAQATLGALLTTPTFTSDGIIEGDVIVDGRIGHAEAVARAQAILTLRRVVEVGLEYTCRDYLTKAGKTVHVDMPAPFNVTGDFKIQRVQISQFSETDTLYPTFAAQASTTRFSLEDLLRIARKS